MDKVYMVVKGSDWGGSEIVSVHTAEAMAIVVCEARAAAENEDNDMQFRRKSAHEWRDGSSYIIIEVHDVR